MPPAESPEPDDALPDASDETRLQALAMALTGLGLLVAIVLWSWLLLRLATRP